MKPRCPKCNGPMREEIDLTGSSRVCMICSHRTWADFTIRSATKKDADTCHTAAHVLRPRRVLTDAERQYIFEQRTAGVPGQIIAEQLNCHRDLIYSAMGKMKAKQQKEVNHA